MTPDARTLLLLSLIPGIGPTRLRSLVNHFRHPDVIAQCSARELIAVEGIDQKTALSIVNFFRRHEPENANPYLNDQFSRLSKVEGRLVSLWEDDYPSLLKKIYDPPPFLFVRGDFLPEDDLSIAIVGTRKPTPYGLQMAGRFADELVRAGVTVVSGLARGVDTAAHTAAVRSGGRTIAVIGSGIDIVYPPENKRLADQVAEHGALVSEFPMGTKPDAMNFPRRNRIISGMTIGTLIIETGVDGGAMITATTALDQNRQVFALPGAVAEGRRSGTHLLIREGRALLVESAADILDELAPQMTHAQGTPLTSRQQPAIELTLFEQRLYDTVSGEPTHIDTLANRSGLSSADTLVHLLSLEFKRLVRQLPGKFFVRS
jgi:DNA processing protein